MADLPIKARVLEYYILNDRPISVEELSEALEEEYQGEKIVNVNNLERIILCYCRVGMLKPVGVDALRRPESLAYQVTESGKKELEFIPGHGNKLF